MYTKKEQRKKRHARIRAKVKGVSQIPRLSVYRANAHIYAQLIDDNTGRTIAANSSLSLRKEKGVLKEKAYKVGKKIAEQAKEKKISRAVFDRGGFTYHGTVDALARGAREGGLIF